MNVSRGFFISAITIVGRDLLDEIVLLRPAAP